MRRITIWITALAIGTGCGTSTSGEGQAEESTAPPGKVETPTSLAEIEKSYEQYKGTGPITSIELGEVPDENMAESGKTVFEAKCTACHKTDKRFIGPAMQGIHNRRTPEWIMNMILNPDEMVKTDPIGKLLFIEYNGSPMANQNLTEEEARQVVEYFRTL